MTDSHLPTLTVKSSPEYADYPKTVIVVAVVAAVVVVANRGTAVIRIVAPGTAPQSGSPSPSSTPRKNKGTEYLFPQSPGVTMFQVRFPTVKRSLNIFYIDFTFGIIFLQFSQSFSATM